MARTYHLHLVSDATGETLNAVAKAACAQFEEAAEPQEHFYALVRSERQLRRVIEQIAIYPGPVFFTMVNPALRAVLEEECRALSVPTVSILDKPVEILRGVLGIEESHRPGGQHEMDSRYLDRVEALSFTIQHDDGQAVQTIDQADVILVGASRTSKTPTCIYLAIRGVRAANIPLVPDMEPPEELFSATQPLIVGLYCSAERLAQIRRNRLATIGERKNSDYIDEETIRNEIAASRKLFERHDWPAIDVSRRSVEETAAAVLNLLTERKRAG
jgi:regulator of PEP synthase PpsR (kinase-PPPase family)